MERRKVNELRTTTLFFRLPLGRTSLIVRQRVITQGLLLNSYLNFPFQVPVYINTSPASPASEKCINTSPAMYINTSPAPEKCINTSPAVYINTSPATPPDKYLHTSPAFFSAGEESGNCRPIYFSGHRLRNLSGFFSAGEAFINTSPAFFGAG